MGVCIYIREFMARMQIVLEDSTEKKLREKAYKQFGLRKGSISKAVEEAIKKWLE